MYSANQYREAVKCFDFLENKAINWAMFQITFYINLSYLFIFLSHKNLPVHYVIVQMNIIKKLNLYFLKWVINEVVSSKK